MNCDKFRENISYYIDDILDGNDKLEFENHMNSCKQCKCEYKQMIVLIDSLNNIEQVALPENYDEALRKRLNNEGLKIKRKWSKYMYIAASLAIVFFSVQNINKLNMMDIEQNTNIQINETVNNEEVQQTSTENIDSKNSGKNNDIDKPKEVSKISDNEKVNKISPKKKEITSNYSMDIKPSIQNEESTRNIQTVKTEEKDNNIMSIQMNSDEPLKQKTRSIAQFNLNNEYQKNVKVGDDFDIILQNPKETSYSMVCDDEDALIEIVSQSVSEDEETYSYEWKFKAIKEGTINIRYILHDKTDKNNVYNEVVYEINIQE
ncbi:anti-sigma factor family protein [Tepidibacter mesophilus]|uniref:anti-sigma factor family protein n=1 Tax=Tepidibacter mesophilus TaxID=655607 RepID=UPI000C068308|nr:zf-HC2 domain-containing protein [Tepidibacter mesophilus]